MKQIFTIVVIFSFTILGIVFLDRFMRHYINKDKWPDPLYNVGERVKTQHIHGIVLRERGCRENSIKTICYDILDTRNGGILNRIPEEILND